MPLPPVAFHSIYELAFRWNRHPADVAGWAAAGHLNVVTGIPPVLCGAETVAGMVQVPMAEFMGLFRRIGPSDEHARIKRVMPLGATTWLAITDPAEGLLVRSFDLLVDAGNLHQFEDERELLPRLVSTIGATPRYDWDAMYAWLFWFAHEKGLPETKTALVSLVQDWFVQNSKSGEVPDESTIRKRLTSLWSKLRGEEPI